MRNAVASALALLLLAACASSGGDRPASIAQPEIQVRQAGPIFFASFTTTPFSIEVQITNRATVPLVLRDIEVSSPGGSSQYTIARSRRQFEETIAPGQTRKFSLDATAVATDASERPANDSLIVRAFVRFEAEGKSFREVSVGTLEPLP